MIWEQIGDGVYRSKIPGGWLVSYHAEDGVALTFVPDPKHAWKADEVIVKPRHEN